MGEREDCAEGGQGRPGVRARAASKESTKSSYLDYTIDGILLGHPLPLPQAESHRSDRVEIILLIVYFYDTPSPSRKQEVAPECEGGLRGSWSLARLLESV